MLPWLLPIAHSIPPALNWSSIPGSRLEKKESPRAARNPTEMFTP